MQFIINLFFFFSLNPFFSPLPILNTDSTPVAHGFSLLTIVLLLINKKTIFINKPAFVLMIFGLISFFFILPEGIFELRYRVGVLGGFLIYWFSTNFLLQFRFNILRVSILFHTFFVCFHYFLPSYFLPIGNLFVRTIKLKRDDMEGFFDLNGRGASGFAAENSFAAVLGIVYIILLYWFYKRKIISKEVLIKYAIISCIPILLSFSASGIFIAILLALIFCTSKLILFLYKKNSFLINSKTLKALIISLIFIVPTLIILNNVFGSTRGFLLLINVFNNPKYFILDSSIADRLVGISIGFLSLFHFPFGLGGGSYPVVAQYIDNLYGITSIFVSPNLIEAGPLKDTVSSFGKYSSEFGLIFISTYCYLFYFSNKNINIYKIIASTLSFLLILQSFSILFPPTYLLLATCILKEKPNSKNSVIE